MTFEIAGRRIGPGEPAFIIAELSANHNGSLEHACLVIEEAARCGADAVKLQTYTADTITLDCDAPPFRIPGEGLWANRTLHDLYKEAYTPWEWHARLRDCAHANGLIIFSSPFDPTAVDFLHELGMPAFKVASFELTDVPLIAYAARLGKPLIMSTGMAVESEIQDAVDAVRRTGNQQLALLKCTSSYPAPAAEANLRTIPALAERFGVVAGLSDHTMGPAVPVAAVALGACIIEKHFCLSRSEGGPDSAFSLEPPELRQLVADIRTAEESLGRAQFEPTAKELLARGYRRSLFAVEDIAAGEELTAKNVRSIRPGHGLAPKHLPEVLGRRAKVAIQRGTPLGWELVV
ncbi:MAG: pseudaminic acid synthase [Candidatus Sumerlaeia bacterium]|nr:pseudaminic acid synthase [Candidatus Sumerlaeia bacterium]